MGTWLLSESMRAWEGQGHSETLPTLPAAARDASRDTPIFDVQDSRFVAPGDMPARIAEWFEERAIAPPRERPVVVRCIVESMAQAFAEALDSAADLSGRAVRTVHIVGGGALNHLLCQAVADRSGRRVLAGPVEATALGNVLIQARTAGAITGELETLRRLVADTQQIARFAPRPTSGTT